MGGSAFSGLRGPAAGALQRQSALVTTKLHRQAKVLNGVAHRREHIDVVVEQSLGVGWKWPMQAGQGFGEHVFKGRAFRFRLGLAAQVAE